MKWVESKEAVGAVDDLLASVGLVHGQRQTRKNAWANGERVPRKQSAGTPRKVKAKTKSQVDVVRAAAFSKEPWLAHGFSTRTGGASRVYKPENVVGDLNLSWTKEDDVKLIAENRRRFVAAVLDERKNFADGKPKQMQLITLRQIHSGVIHVIKQQKDRQISAFGTDAKLATKDGRAVLRGDGVMTDVPGLLLGIQTADCIPVMIADRRKKAVAVFHAGWRGTLARIVERGVGRMQMAFGSRVQDLIAAIGPGIGQSCYSVGENVQHEFESQFSYAPELFREVYDSDPVKEKYPLLFMTARAPGHSNIGPQMHLDLWEANWRQLMDAGVREKNITVIAECTACNPEKYFSHRGEHGFTGRMLNVIGIREN